MLDLVMASGCGIATSYLLQDRLIFGRPRRIRPLKLGEHAGQYKTTAVRLERPDGTVLEGWCAQPLAGSTKRVLLYFGGRNENVAWAADMASYIPNTDIWAYNYRGFGQSTGLPTESRAKLDAQAIYYTLRAKYKSFDHLTLMGRSLGTAVATWLARDTVPDALILLSPFDSVPDVLRRHWIAKVLAPFVRHQFLCADLAPKIECDTLVLLAGDDELVSHDASMQLASRLPRCQAIKLIPGVSHKALPREVDTQMEVARFLLDHGRIRSDCTSQA